MNLVMIVSEEVRSLWVDSLFLTSLLIARGAKHSSLRPRLAVRVLKFLAHTVISRQITSRYFYPWL